MKKLTCILIAVIFFGTANLHAGSVNSTTAKTVAENFYESISQAPAGGLTLTYTEKSPTGDTALYYVYNINQDDGFVIVSGDDAARPILGYSPSGHYIAGNLSPEFAYWMQGYQQQIIYLKRKNIQASPKIKSEWQTHLTANAKMPQNQATLSTSIAPLTSTTWNQSPYYNALCPGGSVTGCVATAMSQIMKYWNYPAKGTGYYSYKEVPPYGILSVNYNSTNYNWAAMPLKLSSNNIDVATLMYDCGVSVNMAYSPSGSSATLQAAQTALVANFGYDPKTIKILSRVAFASHYDSIWITNLKNELDQKRPFNYLGLGQWGGHSWVCDGYDANNNFHMNWGWGGANNGYYPLALTPDSLDRTADVNHNWAYGQYAIIGIQPPTGVQFTGSPLVACSSTTVNFTTKQLTNRDTIIGCKWLFPGGNPSSSTSLNPTVSYNSPGMYNVTEIVNLTKGIDTLIKNAYISVQSATAKALPLSEAFQESSFPPPGWYLNNPGNYADTWQSSPSIGGFGKSTKCMYFNNCNPIVNTAGQRQQIYSPQYDFSAVGNSKLLFDVAYAPYTNLASDTLAIYYSTDCGHTFTLLYLKGGLTLGTAGDSISGTSVNHDASGCFSPLSQNWRTETIDLTALSGEAKVMFAFENRSGYGSNLYIDNINITTNITTSVIPNPDKNSLTLYPNPFSDYTTITFNKSVKHYLELSDITGRKIDFIECSGNQYQFQRNGLSDGMYILKVFDEQKQCISSMKFIIK